MSSKSIRLTAAAALATGIAIIANTPDSEPVADREPDMRDSIANAFFGDMIGRAVANDQNRRALAAQAAPAMHPLAETFRSSIEAFLDNYPAYIKCVLQPPTQLVCIPEEGPSRVFLTAVVPQKAMDMGMGFIDTPRHIARFKSGENVPLWKFEAIQ